MRSAKRLEAIHKLHVIVGALEIAEKTVDKWADKVLSDDPADQINFTTAISTRDNLLKDFYDAMSEYKSIINASKN